MWKRKKVKRNVSTWNGKVIVCKWKKVNEIAPKMLIKVTLQGVNFNKLKRIKLQTRMLCNLMLHLSLWGHRFSVHRLMPCESKEQTDGIWVNSLASLQSTQEGFVSIIVKRSAFMSNWRVFRFLPGPSRGQLDCRHWVAPFIQLSRRYS